MHIVGETLDDVLLELYPKLLASLPLITATRGEFAEAIGALIQIQRPRARLSRSETRGRLFSSLGELLWYLSGDNQLAFIERYVSDYRRESVDGVTVYGGYCPRLFHQRSHDQIQNVIDLLDKRPTSRRAVIQIFNAEDIGSEHREIPCSTTMQFLLRDHRLDMIVTMRSNDAYLGLPHDVFCFTMLQEIVACSLNRDIGVYHHFVGSLHLYEKHFHEAQSLIEEGYQSRIEMPMMPTGDPWPALKSVLKAERSIRNGEQIVLEGLGLEPYWNDLIRIIQAFFCTDNGVIERISNDMSFARYRPYILGRVRRI